MAFLRVFHNFVLVQEILAAPIAEADRLDSVISLQMLGQFDEIVTFPAASSAFQRVFEVRFLEMLSKSAFKPKLGGAEETRKFDLRSLLRGS